MDINIILFIIIFLCLIYIIINLRHKVILLEEKLIKYIDNINKIYLNILETTKLLENIDYKGIFENDDDVGVAFKNIKTTLELLKKTFTNEIKEINDRQTKKEKKN